MVRIIVKTASGTKTHWGLTDYPRTRCGIFLRQGAEKVTANRMIVPSCEKCERGYGIYVGQEVTRHS